MDRQEKAALFRGIQNKKLKLVDVQPEKYKVTYPGWTYPLPAFFINGIQVRTGEFISEVLNDDTAILTVKHKRKQ